jgi:hypothetical protein
MLTHCDLARKVHRCADSPNEAKNVLKTEQSSVCVYHAACICDVCGDHACEISSKNGGCECVHDDVRARARAVRMCVQTRGSILVPQR